MNLTRFFVIVGLVASGMIALGADESPKASTPLRPSSVRSLAYSPDGKFLVVGVGKKGEPGVVFAWNPMNRKILWEHREPAGFSSLSFAPDGKTIAVAHGKPTALLLDPATGRKIGEIGPHPKTVLACVYVPGTNLLATGSDGIIRLWDVKIGKVAKELKGGHPAEVSELVVSPEGRWIISTGPDGTRVWDITTSKELKDKTSQIARTIVRNGTGSRLLGRTAFSLAIVPPRSGFWNSRPVRSCSGTRVTEEESRIHRAWDWLPTTGIARTSA